MHLRFRTRDIFEVELRVKANDARLFVLVMGDFNDEPFDRSVLDELGAVNSVDLLEEEIKKSSQRAHLPDVASNLKRNAALFNYAWEQLGVSDPGTSFFAEPSVHRTKRLFDQIMGSRGIFYGLSGLRVAPQSFAVFAPRLMWTNQRAAATDLCRIRPRAFDRVKKAGYSDHFPATCVLETRSR
ncbi:MAG: hypothetical protein RBT60_13935 [Candidatus Krumholzibacteria bacterium]|nr:hypothetical protein [Candidatus Krumholzibacteria bacterium]